MAVQGDHVDCSRLLLYHKAPIDDVTVVNRGEGKGVECGHGWWVFSNGGLEINVGCHGASVCAPKFLKVAKTI